MMMGAMKLVSFGFSLSDGYKNDEEVQEYLECISSNEKQFKHNSREFHEWQIKELPSLLEFISFNNCFSTALAGPCYDFIQHKNWIEQKGVFANIPSTLPQMFRWFLWLLFFAFCYLVLLGQYLPISFVMSKEFAVKPYWQKFLYTSVIGILSRTKYFFGWAFMEINVVGCGVSYGKDDKGNDRWDTVSWCDPFGDYPFLYTCKERVDRWNVCCSRFFRIYVYNRLMSVFQIQFLCLFLVFMVNAVWHGFYMGYYFACVVIIMPLIEQMKCIFRLNNNVLKDIGWLKTPWKVITWTWVCFISSGCFICLTILEYK